MKTISKDAVLHKLKQENPWWENGQIPDFCRKWIPRPYLDLLLPLLTNTKIRRAVVLMGPRRVGKTILIYHSIQKLLKENTPRECLCYISVDQPIYNGLGLEELLNHYLELTPTQTNRPRTIFFDEIQYLPNWEVHLKTLVDSYPEFKFLVSGSAAAALKLKSNESGAGRFTDFLLPPLTFHEYLVLSGHDLKNPLPKKDHLNTIDFKKLNTQFIHYLNYGGYPEAILSDEIQKDASRFIKNDIIDKVLLRDLPSLYGIHNVQELNALFTTLAHNTAQEVSLDKLTTNSGISKSTISKYIEYLEAAFLIKKVPRIDRHAKHFKRETFFKVYLTNPSLHSALFGPLEAANSDLGSLVETGVLAQNFHDTSIQYYARWDKPQEGEIDFIRLDAHGKPKEALEVKWSDRFAEKPHELKKLIQFCAEHNIPRATITTKTILKETKIQNITLQFIPASLYCYNKGAEMLEIEWINYFFKSNE